MNASQGTSSLFSFPFWLFVDLDDQPKTLEANVDGGRVRFYPPFRSGPANFIGMPAIRAKSIPFRRDTAPDMGNIDTLMTVGGFPGFSGDGPAGNVLRWGEAFEDGDVEGYFPMDSLRLDHYGALPSHEICLRLLRQLRHKSGQWWIGRSTSPVFGFCRNQFKVDQKGRALERPMATVQMTGINGNEKAISNSLWREAIAACASNEPVPYWSSSLMDALFLLYVDDLPMFVVNAANACENLKDIAVETAWTEANPGRRYKRGKVLDGYDLGKHLTTLSVLSGFDFKKDFPSEYVEISKLWDARGSVAHGGALSLSPRFDSSKVDTDAAWKMADAAETFTKWSKERFSV